MNIAIVFAGGSGTRMGISEKPKQFLNVKNKPIIIHTLEKFEKNQMIDAIIVSILPEWTDYFKSLLQEYNIKKVSKIVPGGKTGQMSIFNALDAAKKMYPEDSVVLIHDGVRPFIDDKLIEDNINCVVQNGNAISITYATETVILVDNSEIKNITDRDNTVFAKAPQSFLLKDIYDVHIKAQSEGFLNATDSSTLMYKYGKKLFTVNTDYDNIKITTKKDIIIAESIYERREKSE